MLINSDPKLRAFVEECKNSKYMCIDTEFLREKTYYAKLCLLQIGIEGKVVIIDPFAIRDLTVLQEPLLNPDIVKIFHACSQDVEIIFHEIGVIPTPIFDTQIAASLLGKAQQASYSTLVQQYCNVSLAKKDSFTDWSRRPLSKSQIEYAADDVVYLPQIYDEMMTMLKEQNRLSWLDSAFEELESPQKYTSNPRERYLKLKRVNQLSRKQLACAREFAAWREMKAQKLDIPRKWIVSDEQIVEACRREPTTLDELYMVRGLREKLKPNDAREVLAAIKKGLKCPNEELPELKTKGKNEANVDIIVSLMNAIVQLRAKQNHIAVQTLAPSAELMKLARGHYENCELLKGWRKMIVGKDLLDLLNGKYSLSIHEGNLKISYNHKNEQ